MQEVPSQPKSPVEVVGPFHDYRVVLNGYRVPYVQAIPLADGRYHILIDERFGTHLSVSHDELVNWMPILADAMAVAAGYSSHGEDSQPINRFKCGMSRLAGPPDLTVVE